MKHEDMFSEKCKKIRQWFKMPSFLFGSEDISTEKNNGTKDDKLTRESMYSS